MGSAKWYCNYKQTICFDKEYYTQLKKAAVALQSQRSTAWLNAGGGKLEKFFYNAQDVDNLVIQWKNLAKNLETI